MGRYYSLNDYMQSKYGEKVYKLALDAGFTCPNRDGTVEEGGCIFCADGGGGYFAKNSLEEAKAFLKNQTEDPEPGENEMSNMQYYSDTRTPMSEGNNNEYDDAGDGSYAYYDDAGDGAYSSCDDAGDSAYSSYDDTISYENAGEGAYESYDDVQFNDAKTKNDKESAGTIIYGQGWERKTKSVGDKYIAYYQTYCNTYAPVDELKEIFQPALDDDEIVEIAIATRPDCLGDEVIDLLAKMNSQKPVWVELGLQTIHDKTADYIKRAYPLSTFNEAVQKLREKSIEVIVHLIMGLPGETFEDMLESVKYVNNLDIQGIKIHMLTVLEGTELGRRYTEAVEKLPKNNGIIEFDTKITFEDGMDYHFITLDEYADLISAAIGLLRPEIVIHRLTGDAPKRILLSPKWTGDKKKVLNTINLHLERRNITQGCLINSQS